jgi:lipopolysaccharide/colanic/teichoic acid biosynthesis glycosyltransferase
MSKRAFDLCAAVIGVLLLSPLLAAIAAWIRLDSPGPALFRQVRVGRHGELFRILKFRTMYVQPDAQPGAHPGPQPDAQRLLTVGRDPRITRAGHFLRKYKLDELPQLFNVVHGTMSLVGPRPEVPRYVACYPPRERALVLSVKPGVTDWASILFRDENAILGQAPDPERAYIDTILPTKLEYYLRYVRERTFWVDLRIILHTLRAIAR